MLFYVVDLNFPASNPHALKKGMPIAQFTTVAFKPFILSIFLAWILNPLF